MPTSLESAVATELSAMLRSPIRMSCSSDVCCRGPGMRCWYNEGCTPCALIMSEGGGGGEGDVVIVVPVRGHATLSRLKGRFSRLTLSAPYEHALGGEEKCTRSLLPTFSEAAAQSHFLRRRVAQAPSSSRTYGTPAPPSSCGLSLSSLCAILEAVGPYDLGLGVVSTKLDDSLHLPTSKMSR